MWKKHFFSLLDTSISFEAKEFVDFKLQSIESYHNFSLTESIICSGSQPMCCGTLACHERSPGELQKILKKIIWGR